MTLAAVIDDVTWVTFWWMIGVQQAVYPPTLEIILWARPASLVNDSAYFISIILRNILREVRKVFRSVLSSIKSARFCSWDWAFRMKS